MARKARVSSTVWAPRTSLLAMGFSVFPDVPHHLIVNLLREDRAQEPVEGFTGGFPPLGHGPGRRVVDDKAVVLHHLYGIRFQGRCLFVKPLCRAGRGVEERLV